MCAQPSFLRNVLYFSPLDSENRTNAMQQLSRRFSILILARPLLSFSPITCSRSLPPRTHSPSLVFQRRRNWPLSTLRLDLSHLRPSFLPSFLPAFLPALAGPAADPSPLECFMAHAALEKTVPGTYRGHLPRRGVFGSETERGQMILY